MSKFGQSGIDVYENDPSQETEVGNELKEKFEFPTKGTVYYDVNTAPKSLEEKVGLLKLEVSKLQEELIFLKEKEKEDGRGKEEAEDLAVKIQQLQNLLLEPAKVNSNLTDPQGTIHKKLLSAIESFSSTSEGELKSESEDPPLPQSNLQVTNQLSYQLFYPIKSKNNQVSQKIRQLENRLETLEKKLGSVDQTQTVVISPFYEPPLSIHSPLLLEAQNKSLLEIVLDLAAKSKSLEGQNWMQVEAKGGQILKRLDNIKEKKEILEQKAKMDKISELFNIMLRWNKISPGLPLLLSRLQALRQLHQHALEFNDLLDNLEGTQKQLSSQLTNQKKLLTNVKQQMGNNVSIIKERCEHLQQRITKIQQ